MTKSDLARAMQYCPYGVTNCFLASLRACAVVNAWIADHKAIPVEEAAAYIPQRPAFRACNSRGGKVTGLRRRVHAVM